MKQIMLITDGCSNVGVSPVVAAAHAREEGITVNVVGVVDHGTIGELGAAEIEQIARAGGGMSRIVQPHQLSQTIQMMTRKTVVQTIQHAVNRELQQILGSRGSDGEGGASGSAASGTVAKAAENPYAKESGAYPGGGASVEDLPPEQRAQVVRVMDELSETTPLKVALIIDASASMKPKLAAVEEAIRDLMLSLQAREGRSEMAVFHFPGPRSSDETVLDLDWTSDLSGVRSIFHRIQMKGATPTGPAIFKVIDFYQYDKLNGNRHGTSNGMETDGIFGDYVV